MNAKHASITDKNNYYIGYCAVDESNNPLGYTLEDGEFILDAPLPNCAVNGVLYDESSMLKPRWNKRKKTWVETATEKERNEAMFKFEVEVEIANTLDSEEEELCQA